MHLLALLLAAAPVASTPTAPAAPPADVYPTARGTAGVTLYLPGATDQHLIGGTYFVANDLAARVDFGLSAPLSPSGPGQNKLVTVSVGLRYYGLKRERVGVFVQPALAIGRESSPAVSAEAAEFVRIGGAVGVEYFFTSHFSAGALFELALKIANLGGPAATPVYTSVSTEMSWLSANIYF